jgi:hypothetical protein
LVVLRRGEALKHVDDPVVVNGSPLCGQDLVEYWKTELKCVDDKVWQMFPDEVGFVSGVHQLSYESAIKLLLLIGIDRLRHLYVLEFGLVNFIYYPLAFI